MKYIFVMLSLFVWLGCSTTEVALKPQWIADKNGCKVWNEEPQANESITWSGKCKNGFADKYGTLTFLTNGEVINVYQGEMKRGKSHGKGKFIFENGDAYEGNFYNNDFHGHGKFIYLDGGLSESEFKDGKREGKGRQTWSSGDSYVGNYHNHKIHGKGKYIWADGNSYEGDFNAQKKHGKGTYRWTDGRKYIGQYQNDLMHGNGVLTWSNGEKFVGNWFEGIQGNGEYVTNTSNTRRTFDRYTDSSISTGGGSVQDIRIGSSNNSKVKFEGQCVIPRKMITDNIRRNLHREISKWTGSTQITPYKSRKELKRETLAIPKQNKSICELLSLQIYQYEGEINRALDATDTLSSLVSCGGGRSDGGLNYTEMTAGCLVVTHIRTVYDAAYMCHVACDAGI